MMESKKPELEKNMTKDKEVATKRNNEVCVDRDIWS